MKILYVASEVVPFIKTGGLADVAGALPKALKKLGNDVRVILPLYKQINEDYKKDMKVVAEFNMEFGGKQEKTIIKKIDNYDFPVYFLENSYFFERENLYENDDRDIQFSYFSKVVLEILDKIDFIPNVIHANDWQTGLISLILKKEYPQYKEIKTVYTIHNLRYQGFFENNISDYFNYEEIKDKKYLNFMKLGILNSDILNTVSKTYAKEIQTDYFGEGLNNILKSRAKDLYGIVNGIDMDYFNPATDKTIFKNYDSKSINDKYENKLGMQKEVGLKEDKNTPIIGLVSRLVPEKGLDLIVHVFDEILKDDVQFIVLGSGMDKYEDYFLDLQEKYPDKVRVKIGYDANFANKIYACSDMFLMPSLFEPCGLSQLISLRYGTLPIVRETGGLNDTVLSYNEDTDEGNGFSFTNINAHDMMYTIKRAIDFYKNRKDIWNKLLLRAMEGDYSWENSASEYMKLYEKLILENNKN
ncbi:glycogen synthase GlgA [Haliovirga abyssi]|uniref:Glycogen synthase n=1 Tax=Haliovirga abyssi TaxID=2996794 RepID=A0AAU9DNF4_9FUSO|nr:glycogen synthase GlgA [Haliovirga abyssi]BDU49873.1 glycogen synthase [Haliovirga abyssi]